MTLDHAIRLARVWAFGGVCTLQGGEAQEYHKMALAALEAQRNGVVTVNCSGMDMAEAFCCAGKWKDGDGNG